MGIIIIDCKSNVGSLYLYVHSFLAYLFTIDKRKTFQRMMINSSALIKKLAYVLHLSPGPVSIAYLFRVTLLTAHVVCCSWNSTLSNW